MKCFRAGCALVALVSLMFCTRTLHAQGWPEWQILGGPKNGDNATAIYFFNPTHGVAALVGTGAPYIWFISYPVVHWQRATIPASITAIRSLRLIHDTLFGATNADLIISTDSGRTWKYSGLGLTNANDVYADGTGNIRTLNNPMKVFARVDTLHCVAQGNANIYVSSDGGLTWTNSGVPMTNAVSTGAVGDPCHNVFVCPNSYGTAFRSTDAGQTWRTVVTGSGILSEFLYGESVTSYITSDGGMFRSTDDGQTWISVITINSGPFTPLGVFGPMGEHVILHSAGQFWMTTTGGLDDLHSGVNMTDSNGAPLAQQDTMNVPFRLTSMCNAMKIGIPFESDVYGMFERVTIAKDSLGDFSIPGQDTITLRRGSYADTLWLDYHPHHAFSNVTLNFENRWNCSDWNEQRMVHVIAIPTAQVIPPPAFSGNCHPDREAAFIQLDSCQTIVIDSVYIPSRISGRLQLERPLPDTISRGSFDSLFFIFNPADTVATIFDSVQLFAHFPGMDSALGWWDFRKYLGNVTSDSILPSLTNLTQTIPVRMYALPSVALIPLDTEFAFKRSTVCSNLIDSVITFKNNGCTPDTIEGLTLNGKGFTMPPVSLPVVVPSDSFVSFHIEFSAIDSAFYTGSLLLQVSSGPVEQLRLPITAMGFPHHGIFNASNTAINAGIYSFCEQRTPIIRDTIFNSGCDTLFLSNAEPMDDTAFSLVSPLPASLGPGDTAIMMFGFSMKIKGPHNDTLRFQYAEGRSATVHDTSVSIAGTVVSGAAYLATDFGADFGNMFTCETRDTTIMLVNTGCDTLIIDSLAFTDSSFSSPTQSLRIPGMDSMTITLHVAPDTNSQQTNIYAHILLFTNGIIKVVDYPVELHVAYPHEIVMRVSGAVAASAGNTVTYFVILAQGDTIKTPLNAVSFAVTTNDDLLTLAPPAIAGLHLDSSDTASDLHTITRHYTLSPIPQSDTIAAFQYGVSLAAADSTPILLSDVAFSNMTTLPSGCIGYITVLNSGFTYVNQGCSDTLLHSVLAGGTLEFDYVRPNPARDQIEIKLSSLSKPVPNVRLKLLDVLGRDISEPALFDTESGSYKFDVSALPEGVYYLRAESGGFSVTQGIAIQR